MNDESQSTVAGPPKWMTFGRVAGSLPVAAAPTVATVSFVVWGLLVPDMWLAWIPAGWCLPWAVFNWFAFRHARQQRPLAANPEPFGRHWFLLALLHWTLAVRRFRST